jgi:oligopeptide/dipeptide ABC transporter ATP-binding protein
MADRIAVMYLGTVVETAPADQLYADPHHPYTAALMSAVPSPNARRERARRRTVLVGDVPSPTHPPSGCLFHTRCPLRQQLGEPERCVTERPVLQPAGTPLADHRVACHFADAVQESS